MLCCESQGIFLKNVGGKTRKSQEIRTVKLGRLTDTDGAVEVMHPLWSYMPHMLRLECIGAAVGIRVLGTDEFGPACLYRLSTEEGLIRARPDTTESSDD